MQTAEHEQLRLILQASLDGQRTQTERNKLGQFATPPGLSQEILHHAATLLPRWESTRFLDPAIGTGSFYSALLSESPEGHVVRALGFEIDHHYADVCRAL